VSLREIFKKAGWWRSALLGAVYLLLMYNIQFRYVVRVIYISRRINRLSSVASYEPLIGQIPSPTCPHCGNRDEMAELTIVCPKWAAERQRYFGDSIDITNHVPGL